MIHPRRVNFKKSSTLIFVVAGLEAIIVIILRNNISDAEALALIVSPLIFFALLGYLIRQEFNWTKYILLIVILLKLMVLLFDDDFIRTIPGLVHVVQINIEIWAAVLLFKTPITNDPLQKNIIP